MVRYSARTDEDVTVVYWKLRNFKVVYIIQNLSISKWKSSAVVHLGTTVLLEWNQTRSILCTKHPNLTMLFYYLKEPACYCSQTSTLEMKWALKWGTVWTSISIGMETRKGQSWINVFYEVNNYLLTLTLCIFYAKWDRSSYSTSF